MKYWLFHNNQVAGPYDPEQLSKVQGFSAESLVCPEGRKGTEMGDWQRAGMMPELSEALLEKGKAPAAARAGGPGSGGAQPLGSAAGVPAGSLPPEPTLKDLAFLGSLQEKAKLLEDAVGQLREDLRARDADLAGLKERLAERERAAAELSAKLADTESRVLELKPVREELKQAHEGLARMEEQVGTLKQTIESQDAQIKELRENAAKQKDAAAPALGTHLASVAGPAVTHEIGHIELKPVLAREATQSIPIPAQKSESAPTPVAQSGGPAVGSEKTISLTEKIVSLAPGGAVAPASAEMEKTISLAPSAAPAETEKTIPGIPPMSGMGAAKKSPAAKMGRIAEQESEAVASPVPVFRVPDAKEEPVVLSAGAKKSPKFIPIVIFLALSATAAFYFLSKNSAPPVVPSKAGGSVAGPGGAMPASKAPSETGAQPSSATPGVAARTPAAGAPAAVPQAPAPDPVNAARDFVMSYKIPGASETLGRRLETSYPPSGNLTPWMAEKIDADKFQVNYYTGRKALRYEFIADMKAHEVRAHNPAAQSLINGAGAAPGGPAAGGSIVSEKPKKVAARKRRTARRKPAKARSSRKAAAETPAGAGPDVESSALGGPAAQTLGPAAGSSDDVDIDQLLLPGIPKHSKKKAKQNVPAEESATLPADSSSGPGGSAAEPGGLAAEPIDIPSEPSRH